MTELFDHFGLLRSDPYDDALVENVHPATWENPQPASRYNLVVIGGGTAGLVTAAGAAGLGARVALVERGLLGGDCLNVGCVPSKAVLAASRSWTAARQGQQFGAPANDGPGSFEVAMNRMRRLRADISSHDSAARFRDLGVDVFLGAGRFTGENAVEVDGKQLNFRRAVIATGARAATPPIPGLKEAGYRTNETIFALTELPRRLTVIGGGPIGCELAQAFARFGSEVTIVDVGERILPQDDPDAAQVVYQALTSDGVRYIPKANITSVEVSGGTKTIHFETGRRPDQSAGPGPSALVADEILVATGRAPNVVDLGLEDAGVKFDPRTGVEVDDRMRTANPRIFAAGDVASNFKFTHAADAMARLVIQNALFFGRARASRLVVPWCTYTSPELAHVGLTPEAAHACGVAIDTFTVSMTDSDRATMDGETAGFARIHLEKGKERIVGATIVGEQAGELLAEVTLAMTAGVGIGKIASTVHPYPTRSEVVRKLADAWRRTKLTPTVSKIFATWFRWSG